MWWYIGIIFSVYLLFWVGAAFLQLMVERSRKDPEYSKKLDKKGAKWIPKFDFIQNLVVWGLALGLILFVYLR